MNLYENNFYDNSPEFSSQVKAEALKRADNKCENCKRRPTEKNPLTFHHRYIWRHSARSYEIPRKFVVNPENVTVLCNDCHVKLHKKQKLQDKRDGASHQ